MQQITSNIVTTTIDHDRNETGDAEEKNLAKALKINQCIATIDLSNNTIGDAGAKDLSQALKINQSITAINLYGNYIGYAGAKHIAEALKINQFITNVNIGCNEIGDAGVKDIAEALKVNQSITIIGLHSNTVGDAGAQDIAEALKVNKSITTVNLFTNEIQDAGVTAIAEALKINQSIVTIDLSSNLIGEAGIKDIAEALKINQSITNVNISYNKIGDAGVKAIAEALKINLYITTIDLGHNQIGDAGVKYIAEALKINQCITTIDLMDNGIGDAGAADIAEALKINQSITTICLRINNIQDAGAKNIAEALKLNRSITTIDLESNKMGDAGMKDIAEALKINLSVTTIDLGSNQIGDDGVKYIAEALKINQSITNVNISYNKIGHAGVKAIAEALQINLYITTIDLGNNQIGDAGATDMAKTVKINRSITSIDLKCNEIGDAGMKDIAEALKSNQSVTTIDLSSNQIGDAGMKDMAEALKTNPSVTTINISRNEIGDAGVKDLSEALKINQSVTEISLQTNKIGDAGAMDIADTLKINQSITTIRLQGNEIGDAGAKHIAEALKINQSVTTIDLAENEIGDVGAKDIAEALKINQSVTTIDLEENQIEDAGAKDIAEALKINLSVTTIHLDGNQIGDAVAKDIKDSLNINQSILRIKEAERVGQLTKLRDQESAKAITKAAKLKAQEEVKVKEYVPYIPVVKLFEVVEAGEDNEFDNNDQATICEVSNLIREGNYRLQDCGKKGILLLGDTGAGKSTLAHLLTGRKLQAIMDDEINEIIIDALQPLENIVIGHKLASETKIPNKCFTKDVIIWDCPGFNDTDAVQEIANSFYIKRLFETTDQLKFVLVIAESHLKSKRGNDFLEILSNFMKSFKDVGCIEGSISLVVSHVSKNKNIQHIRKSIEKILINNQRAKEKHRRLVTKLKDCSVHLFHKPTEEGELPASNLFEAIDSSTKYSDVKSDMINITISKEAKVCSSHLLNAASSNFNQLLEVIVRAITDATKCLSINPLNVFSENYYLIKDWIPSSIHYKNLPEKHNKDEYFLELDLLLKLQKVLNCNQIISMPDAIIIFQQAVEIFAEYVELGDVQLQHKIQGYGYCLEQQYEYVKFFACICGVELPDHVKIAQLITAVCHAKVTENLEYQVSSLRIDEKKFDQVYYHKAVKYLDGYPESPVCKNLKAIAYSCLANIVEQNGEDGALTYYVKAIGANRKLPEIYEKLGHLLSKNNRYAKAISCYKVVNNEFRIRECFKAWLKQDRNNPDIMLKQATYYESIGLFEQAKKYYHHTFSLSKDNSCKAAALQKIGNIMVNAADHGQNFITRAAEQNFYNYDLVDDTFINNLLGDIVEQM